MFAASRSSLSLTAPYLRLREITDTFYHPDISYHVSQSISLNGTWSEPQEPRESSLTICLDNIKIEKAIFPA